jgi:hypothetical protein
MCTLHDWVDTLTCSYLSESKATPEIAQNVLAVLHSILEKRNLASLAIKQHTDNIASMKVVTIHLFRVGS